MRRAQPQLSPTLSTLLNEFRLPFHVTLIGPPGSGKGTYGRLLSQAWNPAPIYSVSDILRQQQQQHDSVGSVITSNLNTGKLVDCEVVSQIVLSFLQDLSGSNQEHRHFIMDGYPRTKRQIDIMIQTWPLELHITRAIHLDMPNSVCQAKMIGRRRCSHCNGEPNVADVNEDGFHLPPFMPSVCQAEMCHPDTHWIISRPDDNDIAIVQKRLRDYRQHESALLDYYYNRTGKGQTDHNTLGSRCISVTPYHGIQDFSKMQQTIEEWLTLQHLQQK